MDYMIGIRQSLIWIFQSSFIAYFTLAMGCNRTTCVGKPSKDAIVSDSKTALELSASLEENHTPQEAHKAKEAGSLLDDPKQGSKEVKKLKRIAKVAPSKQVILLLHGVNRLSYDFHTMEAALRQKFPHAIIIAPKFLNKDGSKKGILSGFSSPTALCSISQDQTKSVYEEIKETIPSGSHIIIVGHSQGGLRGFAFVKEYAFPLRKADIHIAHLITIATPWKGAPIMDHIKTPEQVVDKFKMIEDTLNAVEKDYGQAVLKYFFRFQPKLAKHFPSLYKKIVEYSNSYITSKYKGLTDLDPTSNFIRHYIPSGLKTVDLPITAIAGVLTDFSKLFDPFPSSVRPQELEKLNHIYADIIGGSPTCEHDMLLPVATQHAEGLAKKNFTCIKVYGACHGNKVGITVKKGLSELNNKDVIQKVVESIEATFYEEKETLLVTKEGRAAPAG